MNFNFDIVIYVCTIITSIAAAAAIITKVVKATVEKVVEASIKKYIEDYDKGISKRLDTLTSALNKHIDNYNRDNSNIKETLLAQSRIEINQIYNNYSNLDKIGTFTMSSLEELYKAYVKLGGNSFIETEMEYLRGLKVVNS